MAEADRSPFFIHGPKTEASDRETRDGSRAYDIAYQLSGGMAHPPIHGVPAWKEMQS